MSQPPTDLNLGFEMREDVPGAEWRYGRVHTIPESLPRASHSTEKDTEKAKLFKSAVKRNLIVKYIHMAGTALSLLSAIVCIVLGALMLREDNMQILSWIKKTVMLSGLVTIPFGSRGQYLIGHRVYRVPEIATVLITILFNVAITAGMDSMGVIQAVTLRWALIADGRLRFLSNPRWFSSASSHLPNHWTLKLPSALFQALAYGAISCIISSRTFIAVDTAKPRSEWPIYSAIDFSGTPILFLGGSLAIQAFIAIACLLCKPSQVRTWSSNPLMNVIAAREYHEEGSCRQKDCDICAIINVQELKLRLSPTTSHPDPATDQHNSSVVAKPEANTTTKTTTEAKAKLPSAFNRVPSVRYTLYAIWASVLLCAFWTGATALHTSRLHMTLKSPNGQNVTVNYLSAAAVKRLGGATDADSYWSAWGVMMLQYSIPEWVDQGEWLPVLIQSAAQLLPSLVLHAAEHILDVVRDEWVWRDAGRLAAGEENAIGRSGWLGGFKSRLAGVRARVKGVGAPVDPPLVIGWLADWPHLVFLLFKAVAQWVFGNAFRVNIAVFMVLLPTIVFSAMMLLTAIVVTWLALWKPKGVQPATYGELARTIELMNGFKEGERFVWSKHGKL